MSTVTIFHNIARDNSLGLNAVLRTGTEAPEGVRSFRVNDSTVGWTAQGTGAERHELVKVFAYDVEDAEPMTILENAFRTFNIGEDATAQAYRSRRLRSLSVGDVVTIDGQAYSCESAGWAERQGSELRIVDGPEATKAIRIRYQFRSIEPLAITVPL